MNRYSLVALALIAAASAVPVDVKDGVRDKKAVSLFAVVTFPNDQCTAGSTTSSETTHGTCFSSTECTDKGGTADGNCASGFGTCCVFTVSSASGGTVSQNCTYIENNGYPSAITTATQSIAYTVNYVQDDICQLRLDMTNFVLPITATTGVCIGTMTVNGPTVKDPPALCGTNTGEHVYVEVGRSSTATTITMATGAGTTSRSWKIKVSQIECSSKMKAPTDCAQYYTGISGNFHSFNFDGGLLQTAQQHAICFRQEMGYCGINYSVDEGQTTPDPFDLNAAADDAVSETHACTIGRITVPLSTGSGFFCGGSLSVIDADTASGIVRSTVTPFVVAVTVNGIDVTGSSGFFLNWSQVPC